MTIKKKPVAVNARNTVPAKSSAAASAPAGPSPSALQMKAFDDAVQLFSKRRFAEAAGQFREAVKGPAVHIADKARSYIQICERQTAKQAVDLRTAEDHFTYGVERLNARDISQARAHLTRALGMEPAGDHILYTMALCCGLAGDADGAYENLKRAIDIEPRNRILARQDPEFTALVQQIPGLRALLSADVRNG